MKHIYLCWLFCFPVILCAQSKKYEINGTIGTERNQQHIYLYYNAQGTPRMDSCLIKKGTFSFSGTVGTSDWAFLTLKNPSDYSHSFFQPNPITFYLQPGKIRVVSPDSLLHAKLIGNLLTNEYQQFRNELQPYEEGLFALENRYKKVAAITSMDAFIGQNVEELKGIMESISRVTRNFIKNHPGSLVSAHLITSNADSFPDVKKIDDLLSLLSPKLKTIPDVVAVIGLIEGVKRTEIGKQAPEFAQNDTSGRSVSLKNFRGKYVLLDFWASWCSPCRADNPNVVKAYMTYKDKNFTVLSVSLDKANGKQAWINAINKDGMPWTHVSDLKFFGNEVAKLYGIQAIPQNFLIGPNGKIIAKNLRGEALISKLAEVIGSTDPTSINHGSE